MNGRGGARRSALGARRVLGWVAIIGVAYFAVQGGEYGTVALVRQRLERRALRHAVDSLQRQVDSLARAKEALLTDAAVQERIAREEFGMIKAKELLYRFAEPADSGKVTKKP